MKAALIALAFAAGIASPVLAANARHPYQNIDRRVDQGGPTGDDQVERLNQQQLQGGGAPGMGMHDQMMNDQMHDQMMDRGMQRPGMGMRQ